MVRSTLFNAVFWTWTAVLAVLMLPTLALPRGVIVAFGRLWSTGIHRALAGIVGLDYEVRGRQRVPASPAIYAFKHQSAFETLIQHRLFEDPAIALKRELIQIPLFGWYCRKAGMIRIDRARGLASLRGLIREAKDALDRGAEIVIFPEGTRVAPGERHPFHPGIAALYLQLGVPVVPVALNSGLFWGRRRFRKRPGRIVLEFLPPIAPGLARGAFMTELERRLEPATERLLEEGRAQLAGRC